MEKWFKFYSADYLIDGKMRKLNANERSCFITLLCLADISDIPGEIRNLDSEDLLYMSGVSNASGEQILSKLEAFNILKRNDNAMITICNFRKRQGKALNTYQRVKKYRLSKDDETESNEVGTSLEEKRKEENRIEDNIYITPKKETEEFFKNPEPVIQELITKGYPEQPVRSEVKKFINYWTELNSTGKKQKWELQKTFEVNRRLATWFGNVRQFNKPLSNQKKGIIL